MADSEASNADGRAVLDFSSKLKLGIQGLKSAFAAEEPTTEARNPEARSRAEGKEAVSSSSWTSWAERARMMVQEKVAYDPVPQDTGSQASNHGGDPDVERGEGLEKFAAWATSMAGKVQLKVAVAAGEARQGLEKAAEKAKSVDPKGWQSEVAKGLSRVTEQAEKAGQVFSEKGKAAQQLAKDIGGKSQQKLAEAKALGAAGAAKAKEKATAAAGIAKEKLSAAGSNISGLGALALSPAKLAQFMGIFFAGIFLISISFSFLPVMVIAPQKFSLLFAFGSITLLSSFAVLKGPQAFLSGMTQKAQLPFTIAFVVGLVGTFVATIILKSFILTAIFGLMQAAALLYFLASYVPGGKAVLNFCGRGCSKAARTMLCRAVQ